MDLWIRSQDKTLLVKADYIQRVNNLIRSGITLGIYNSEERAVEILDEIQLILSKKLLKTNTVKHEGILSEADIFKEQQRLADLGIVKSYEEVNVKPMGAIVYEMPKE